MVVQWMGPVKFTKSYVMISILCYIDESNRNSDRASLKYQHCRLLINFWSDKIMITIFITDNRSVN